MKLTTITHVSVDGVMQGLGGSGEDRRGGFERGGWALPLFYGEATEVLKQVFPRADAFLFGPWTYEGFAGSWGAIAKIRAPPIPVAVNGAAPDDRPVPAGRPRPPHVGSEKYLGGFWIIEASDLDVALKLAAEGSEACNRKVEVRRNAAKAVGRAYGRRRSPVVNPRMNKETKSHN